MAKEFKIIEIERQKIENKEKLENVKLNKIKKWLNFKNEKNLFKVELEIKLK